MLKQRKKAHLKAFYASTRIERPTSRSKSTQDAKKHTSNQLESGTRIQGPTNRRKPPKPTTNHAIPTWGPIGATGDVQGVSRLAGSPNPGWLPFQVSFGGSPSCALPKASMAYVSIRRDGRNHPIQAIKGGEPPIQHTIREEKSSTPRRSPTSSHGLLG